MLSLGPAQGGFVELTFPGAGTYPFVSHVMVDVERGGAFRCVPGRGQPAGPASGTTATAVLVAP